jgi:hypothetical protein
MGGNAVAQGEKGFEPVLLGMAEVLHVIEGLPGAEQRANGDDQDVNQIVVFGAVDPGIGQVLEIGKQAVGAAGGMIG